MYPSGFYGHPPQQPQNVYQQMGIPQPQPHLNYIPPQRSPIRSPVQPPRYSAANPPTSSFPNQPKLQQQQQQQQQPQSRPLPAPTVLPVSKPPRTPTRSPSRPLPTPAKRTTIDLSLNSLAQNTSLSPPKRRQSPPKFNSNPSSESSSPTKQSFPSNPETSTTKPTATSASVTTSFTSSSPQKPPPLSSSSFSSTSTTSDVQPAKKPNPVWKRTIPEIPAPVWGYAAGLVADPHPQSSKPPPPQVQVQANVNGVSPPESPTKSGGVSNKLKKRNKAKDRTKDERKKSNKGNDQISAVLGNAYGIGYSSKQAQAQRYFPHQYTGHPQQQQASYPISRTSAMINGATAGYRSRDEDEDEETETETGEEEETGEGESETGEEEDASDADPTLSRFGHGNGNGNGNGHRRYYSQPLANKPGAHQRNGGMHRREEGYHGSNYDYEEEEEDEEDTPKKRNLPSGFSKVPTGVEKKIVLRPKVKVDPYGGYEDVSPIGHGTGKKVRSRSGVEDIGAWSGAVDTMVRTSRNKKAVGKGEVERDGFVRKSRGDEGPIRPAHRRALSAIEERELLVLNARRNRRRNREIESDFSVEEDEDVRLAYDDEYEEDAQANDRKRREDWMFRPRSQPNSSSRLRGEGRSTAAGLPRPPAMIKDRDGGGLASFSQAEKKIRGGPRSAHVHHVSEGEAEEYHGEGRGAGRWPGNLPKLPRTPGGEGGKRGYFGAPFNAPDLNLDEPPPPPSIVRTPSPTVAGGYVLQKREVESRSQSAGFEQTRRRFEGLDDVRERAQIQGRVYSSRMGHPPQEMPQSQVPQHPQRQYASGLPQQGRFVATPSPRKYQQTPAPPPPVGIEAPSPLGGRDRIADMNKLERGEEEGQIHERRITDVRNVPRVMVMGDNGDNGTGPIIPTMTVSGGSDRRPLPSPSRTRFGSRPQSTMVSHGFGTSPAKQTSPALPLASVAGNPRETPRSRSSPVNNNAPAIQVFDVPGVYISKPGFDDDDDDDSSGGRVMINISGPDDDQNDQTQSRRPPQRHPPSHPHPTSSQYPTPSVSVGSHSPYAGRAEGGRGLICGGCHGPIAHGRILSAMGSRWHPTCFKCTVCNTLLEHVSSYEHDGKAFCHLDYHEAFAPRCYSCKTAIVDEQFISLDDPALGKRTYHTQHFFCSECGDPFLDPSIPLPTDANGELALSGDGEFEGFTVYKGYPYCEACHVRLRLPKCKRCKKAIRDHEEAVEALGGKWCWGCFVCAGCSEPFEDPSFFQRGNQPYCESCFSIILRNEV